MTSTRSENWRSKKDSSRLRTVADAYIRFLWLTSFVWAFTNFKPCFTPHTTMVWKDWKGHQSKRPRIPNPKKKDKHINNHNYKHVTKHLGNSNPSLTLIMTKFDTKLKIKNLQTSLQTTLVLNEFSENLKRSCAYWNFKSILVCNKNLQQEQDFTKNLKRAQRG